jgi:hypothetical protein
MEIVEFEQAKCRRTFVLPPHDTVRWVANRKAAIVMAIRDRAISRKHACERYQLSLEELANWEAAFEQHGTAGLRAASRPRRSVRYGPAHPQEAHS